MPRLSDADRKRVSRNIFAVQRALAQLSGRPESEMARALTFFRVVATAAAGATNLDAGESPASAAASWFALIRESGESYIPDECPLVRPGRPSDQSPK